MTSQQVYLSIFVIIFNLMYLTLYAIGDTLNLHIKSFKDKQKNEKHIFWKFGGFCWFIEVFLSLIWPFSNIYIKILFLFLYYDPLFPFLCRVYGEYLSVPPLSLLIFNIFHHSGLCLMLIYMNEYQNSNMWIYQAMIWLLHWTNCNILPKSFRDKTESFIFIISSLGTYLAIFDIDKQYLWMLILYLLSRLYFYFIIERLSKSRIKFWFRNGEFVFFIIRIILEMINQIINT